MGSNQNSNSRKGFIVGILIFVIVLLGFLGFLLSAYFAKEKVSYVIKNGDVLTIDDNMQRFENGAVIVKDNKIVEVGDASIADKYSANKVIDAHGGIVMPGLINAHQHIPMIAFRGLGEEGIENRLFGYFMPLESNKLSRDLIHKATTHGCIEMALGGVTTYADMYYYEDEIAEATKEIGLRGVLGETVIKNPTVDSPQAYGGLAYAEEFIKNYKHDELIVPAVAPHADYSLSAEKLLECKALGDKYDVPVLCHIAEMNTDHDKIGLDSNTSVIQYLDNIGFLSPRLLCAHSIYVDDKDLDIMKSRGCSVSYNPLANAKGATGIANAKAMLDKGIPVGIGTDGPMGNNFADIIPSLSYASSMQRLKYDDRTIMTPDVVLRMATRGGAEALGLLDKLGSLEAGKLADIIIIETDSANMVPNYEPYATVVFSSTSSNVNTVMVNGKIIVEDKNVCTYDINKDRKNMEEIKADVAVFAKELAIKTKEN